MTVLSWVRYDNNYHPASFLHIMLEILILVGGLPLQHFYRFLMSSLIIYLFTLHLGIGIYMYCLLPLKVITRFYNISDTCHVSQIFIPDFVFQTNSFASVKISATWVKLRSTYTLLEHFSLETHWYFCFSNIFNVQHTVQIFFNICRNSQICLFLSILISWPMYMTTY